MRRPDVGQRGSRHISRKRGMHSQERGLKPTAMLGSALSGIKRITFGWDAENIPSKGERGYKGCVRKEEPGGGREKVLWRSWEDGGKQ